VERERAHRPTEVSAHFAPHSVDLLVESATLAVELLVQSAKSALTGSRHGRHTTGGIESCEIASGTLCTESMSGSAFPG
jgi:hypothetical protein